MVSSRTEQLTSCGHQDLLQRQASNKELDSDQQLAIRAFENEDAEHALCRSNAYRSILSNKIELPQVSV